MIELDPYNGAAAGAEQFEVARLRQMFHSEPASGQPSIQIAPGLYARAAAGFESFLLVEPGSTSFCIEWHDHSSDTWLRGKGRIHEVAESEDALGVSWEMYLTGDFAVSVPEDAVPSEGLECYDGKALEQLLTSLQRLLSRQAKPAKRKGATSSRKGAASSRTGKATAVVERELREQSYTWRFDLDFPEGVGSEEARAWLAESVERELVCKERTSVVRRLTSSSYPFGVSEATTSEAFGHGREDEEQEGTEEGSMTDEEVQSDTSHLSTSSVAPEIKSPDSARGSTPPPRKRANASKGSKQAPNSSRGKKGTANGAPAGRPLSSRRASSPSGAKRKSATHVH